jgi:hypothetical protein
VKRALTDAVGCAVLGGIAVIAVTLLHSGATGLAVDAYLLFLGALALIATTRVTAHLTGSHEPSEIEALLRPPRRQLWQRRERQQLPELARVEREVSLACGNSFDLHVRLRPTISEIAENRLLGRHGVVLAENRERARELLGETTWDLVRPDRQPPVLRHAAGLSTSELEEIIGSLERL